MTFRPHSWLITDFSKVWNSFFFFWYSFSNFKNFRERERYEERERDWEGTHVCDSQKDNFMELNLSFHLYLGSGNKT